MALVLASGGAAYSVFQSASFEINPLGVTQGGSPVDAAQNDLQSANFAMLNTVGETTGDRMDSSRFQVQLGILGQIPGQVDVDISLIESDKAVVDADGVDVAQITVTLTDVFGTAIAGRTVELAATGAGNVLIQPGAVTDDAGQATGTLASTVAETKTVTARIDGVLDLAVALDISFIDGNQIVAGSLFITPGENNGIDSVEDFSGAVTMTQLLVQASDTEDILLTDISFTANGTGDDDTAIAQADLVLDVDGSGVFELGTDVVLQSVGLPFAVDDGDVTFAGVNITVPADGSLNLILVFQFSGLANEGDTFAVSHLPTAQALAVGLATGLPITPVGQGAIGGGDITTSAILQGTLAFRKGPGNFVARDVFEATGFQEMLHLVVTASTRESIQIDTIDIQSSGDGNEATDVEGVSIALDVNQDGDFDPGLDQLIGDVNVLFAADNGQVTIDNLNRFIPAGEQERWIVLFDFVATALGGTFAARVDNAADVTALGDDTGIAPTVAGLPRVGGEVNFEGDPLAAGTVNGPFRARRRGGCDAGDSGNGPGPVAPIVLLLMLLMALRLRQEGLRMLSSVTVGRAVKVAAVALALAFVGLQASACSSRTTRIFNNRPTALVSDLQGVQEGNVVIGFTLTDPEGNDIDIDIEFSVDGGVTFVALTEAAGAGSEGTENLSSDVDGEQHIFVWDSAAQILAGSGDVTVVVRITPFDPFRGNDDVTGAFVVNNDGNVAPEVVVTDLAGDQFLDTSILFELTDEDGDFIDIVVEFSDDGGQTFNVATEGGGGDGTVNLDADANGVDHVFVWDSFADLGGVINDLVRIQITPDDGLEVGASDLTANFTIDNTELFVETDLLAASRGEPAVALLGDGRVVVAGGRDEDGDAQDSAEIFDPGTQTFSNVLDDMVADRAGATATLFTINDDVLITGGANANADVFQGDSDDFGDVVNDPDPRVDHQAVLLADGRVLITGGRGAGDGLVRDSAMIFDNVNDPNNIVLIGNTMNVARADHAMVLLQNGLVLIAGGRDDNGVTVKTAELFDPNDDSFTAVGDMTFAREAFTLTVLPSAGGQVLVAGGTNENDIRLESLEIFTPGLIGGANNFFTLLAGQDLSVTRTRHTATLVESGGADVVLLAGGLQRAGGDIVEVGNDPINGTLQIRQPKNAMGVIRGNHGAALIDVDGDDRVILIGGDDFLGDGQPDADFFVPDEGAANP